MPDSRELLDKTALISSNASGMNRDIDEGIRRLKVHDDHDGEDGDTNHYPDRPGEPDCVYYIRTGFCGFGNNCRYNHPTPIERGAQAKTQLPERVGQPNCQYFLKKGMCKFGSSCKYHHPRDKLDLQSLPLNVLGLPIRQDQKSCPYYMRTGACKFGVACKFNHPPPAAIGTVLPLAGQANGDTSMSGHGFHNFSAYMPVMLPHSPVAQGWTPYMNQGIGNHHSSPDVLPNSNNNLQLSPSKTANLPERPDQPECQYYMRTGSCKYGSNCKYHHPKERSSQNTSTLGPLGFPLRPGQPVCSFYSLHGTCRYGANCKFDHPFIGYYDYAVPAVYFPDSMAHFHNQSNHQAAFTSWQPAANKTMKSEPENEAFCSNNNEKDTEKDGNLSILTSSTSRIAPSS